ncbi:nuclease-related domain protein [Rhodococcus sp. Br-6]|nr:nuclease-related domain protein [Rhodococcus sp. Br-6]
MNTADAASGQPAASATRGDDPAVAGRSLRARSTAQRRALRVLTAHFIIAVATTIAAAVATALLFFLPFEDALTVWAYAAAATAALYGLVTFPRRAAGLGLGLAAAATTFWCGSRTDAGTWPQWAAVAAAALIAGSVFSTRRDLRDPYLPAAGALAVTVASFAAVTAFGISDWLWAPPAAAAGIAAVAWRGDWPLTYRARRAGIRSGIKYRTGHHLATRPEGDGRWMDDAHLDVGADAEAITATQLAELGDRWHVLHSRALHNTVADADHIVIGPPGVILVDSKYRSGRFECHPWVDDQGTTGVDWAYNGEPIDTALVGSSLFEADRIAWAFHADNVSGQPVPVVLAIHGARMNVPWGELTIDILDINDGEGDDTSPTVVDTKTVTLVDATHLTDYLQQLPDRRFTNPSRKEQTDGAAAGLSGEEIDARAQTRYVADLATVADHVFLPVRD